ncbi:peroxidase 12 [Carica papaya]|uniref:peroxidase 12 n=1 Tax=Carica papaya TaxID=3649 RepID=UPI000B8CF3BD|nr:peroxidase 12 [Carica papaya]
MAASAAYLLLLASLLAAPFLCLSEVDLSSVPIKDGLSWTFYKQSCPKIESIIRKQLQKELKKDIGLAAALLRIHFHDCFVQGCDGSVLLSGSAGGPSDEQATPPNLSLRKEAFKVINDLSVRIQRQCGLVASCSDIAALAARDSVFLSGGPDYSIPLGRRDGTTFASFDATMASLPPPFAKTGRLIEMFAVFDLDTVDMVALSGGHTIGIGHCAGFVPRLFPTQDPTMDKTLAKKLRNICPTTNSTNFTDLDIRTPNIFDNKYYLDLMNRQGLFTSDQDLFIDQRTKGLVIEFAVNQNKFFEKFIIAMVKMSQISVLTRSQGQIRANCSLINSRYTGDDHLVSVVDAEKEEVAGSGWSRF